MTNTHQPVLTGGCQCGAVRYALYAKPVAAGLCYCRMCQKAVGGPFMAWAKVHTEDFAWTRGKPSVFRSSSAAERGFCAACGTPLSFAYLKRPEAISLTLGTFDEPGRVQFTVIDGIEGRWESLDPARLQNLPAHTTAEAPAPEDLSRIQKHQHPDHETP